MISKKFLSVFVMGVLSISCLNATETLYDSIPSNELQFNIINSDLYRHGFDNIIKNVEGMSIRALIGWSRELTGSTHDVEVFYSTYPAFTYEINPDVSNEKNDFLIEKQRLQFEEYKFSTYPAYQCCNVQELLENNTILMNVTTHLRDRNIIDVSIIAYLPYNNDNNDFFSYVMVSCKYTYDYDFRTYSYKCKKISIPSLKLTTFKKTDLLTISDLWPYQN